VSANALSEMGTVWENLILYHLRSRNKRN